MFDVVTPDHRHRAFIEDTLLRSASECWPWNMIEWPKLRKDFRRRTKGPDVKMGVAVLKSDPDSYLGWAAVVPRDNEVIYAYTPSAYRTKTQVLPGGGSIKFEPRVCSTLLTALGIDTTREVTIRYWTAASEAISRHDGWKLRKA